MTPTGPLTDRFAGQVVPDAEGLWSFRVDAWSDPWATWRHAVEVKTRAGQGASELANDLENGARLLERGAAGIQQRLRDTPRLDDEEPVDLVRRAGSTSDGPSSRQPSTAAGGTERTGGIAMPPVLDLARTLIRAARELRATDRDLPDRLGLALSGPVHRTMTEHPVRELVTEGETHHVQVERSLALAGAWYEFFPRSTGGWDEDGPVHGTFATATAQLDRAAAMGFDVAYLPPIHPVGTVNRKGPNNTLTPGPDDVGSPWAIGSADGGHDAIDPNLGTIEDFDAFVAHAHDLGLEVALDLALQCAPDHPWAVEHPEWFTIRPDGTIAYAENPPKRYQDIYPVNFDTDPEGIYAEVLRIVLYWMEHGVRVFRVDNPHTKPPDFWNWLIAEVHRRDPGVVFLAEAFTRPARLFGLAKAGFSQSYTYFTWRTGRDELREFFEMHRDRLDECRPNCFVNTPDILHESLQVGGPGMFAIRAALAATLSPSWGVYSGFELFEHQPVRQGSEEYLDSEKYQLRPRDFAGALAEGRSLEPWITRLNQLRRDHPALRQLRTLRFHDTDNAALLAYSKTDPLTGDTVLCVVTLDPFGVEEGTVHLDMPALGLEWHDRFGAFDEVSGQTFEWGQANYVRLEPWRDVAHIISVIRR
jgi:starch synthase (maltosyl-transferring)